MRRPLVVLLLAACGTRAPAHRQRPVAAESRQADSTPPDSTPPDSTPPAARAGALVSRAIAAPGPLTGQWRPQAGVCMDPPSFQLFARSDSVDLLLLLELPRDTVAPGTYVVVSQADSTRQPRTARFGAQLTPPADRAYQATGGVVRLERLDRLATGRFDMTLQEVPSHRALRYLGVFEAIPVDTLGLAVCRSLVPDTASQAPRRKPA
jgi:hypothetical protein